MKGIHRLHLVGDRQAGKTEAALAYAGTLISCGIKAVYCVDDSFMVKDSLVRFVLRGGQTVCDAYGKERIDDPSGGVVYFTSMRRRNPLPQRDSVTTVFLDTYRSAAWDDEGIQCEYPSVTNIIRTVM
jgi:hypothetical protein